MIISDTMQDIKSMTDGKYYSSKSELRKSYKANGVIEMGNDAPTTQAPPVLKEISEKEVADAYQKVVQGYKPKKLKKYTKT